MDSGFIDKPAASRASGSKSKGCSKRSAKLSQHDYGHAQIHPCHSYTIASPLRPPYHPVILSCLPGWSQLCQVLSRCQGAPAPL